MERLSIKKIRLLSLGLVGIFVLLSIGVTFLIGRHTVNWTSQRLYVNPQNGATLYAQAHPNDSDATFIAREGNQPVARWFGNWDKNVNTDAKAYTSKAATADAIPLLVAYNIPDRDCGGLSAGGAQTAAAYATWISQLTAGIGNNPAVVILEPDAISLQTCLNSSQLAARYQELSNAVTILMSHKNTFVYIDAGHPNWISAQTTAQRLAKAGVAKATGFALNTSNFTTTASNITYGNSISRLVSGKHYVIDTSRNGNGPTADAQWCNPSGRALGNTPTTTTASPAADAYLWVKTPWASDGSCNGNPPAGQDNWAYAIQLAKNAGWSS